VAVTAARAAFDEGPWPKMSGRERARILHKAAGLVRASAEEIVRLQSLDVGKPVSLRLPADVPTTAEHTSTTRPSPSRWTARHRRSRSTRTPAPAASRSAHSGPCAYRLAGAQRTQI